MKPKRPTQSRFPINQTDEQSAQAVVSNPPDGDDVIADFVYRLAERAQVAAVVLLEIENEIRSDYCGERCYVARQRGDYRAYVTNRNTLIVRDSRLGESNPLLARRYGVSLRRIEQILRAARKP